MKRMGIKDFGLKFIDVMIGIVLGLGFQWWPNLHLPWQYVAFIFVYFDIVDYWIDYAPSLRKFPPKRELDLMLDVAIMFSLFLYIYATQLTVVYFLAAFVIARVFDLLWLLRAKAEYHPLGAERIYVDTWVHFNIVDILVTLAFISARSYWSIEEGMILAGFIFFRVIVRIVASLRYKKVYFA